MELEEELNQHLHRRDIERLLNRVLAASEVTRLLELALKNDNRVGYNALWAFTLFSLSNRRRLSPFRQSFINAVFGAEHTGRKRLLLNLLESFHWEKDDLQPAFLDFCLNGINSNEPYAIRAFCLKLAYAQCRHFPELMAELNAQIELMELGELPPGLHGARRNILKKIASHAAKTTTQQ